MKPSDAIRDLDPETVGDMVRRHLNGIHHARARLLRLLVREPELTTNELAERVNRSPSTVRHYLAILRSQGLKGYFGDNPRARRLTLHQRDRLIAEVRSGNFRSLAEIRDRVEEHFGVSYTIPGVRKLLRDSMPLDRRIVADDAVHAWKGSDQTRRLTTFLNALPVSTDATEWTREFQNAFATLFPNLAGIATLLNRSSTLGNAPRTNVTTSILDIHVVAGKKSRSERDAVDRKRRDLVSTILAQMKQIGKDADNFYPPIDFVAALGEGDWVGRILLFFHNSSPDPRDEVEAWLESLRPFLTFCLSDGVARNLVGSPQHRHFQLAIDRLVYRYRLTMREREIVMLYLSGSTIEEISGDLNIAPSTVRNHIYNSHRKTNTRHQRELFNLVLNL